MIVVICTKWFNDTAGNIFVNVMYWKGGQKKKDEFWYMLQHFVKQMPSLTTLLNLNISKSMFLRSGIKRHNLYFESSLIVFQQHLVKQLIKHKRNFLIKIQLIVTRIVTKFSYALRMFSNYKLILHFFSM